MSEQLLFKTNNLIRESKDLSVYGKDFQIKLMSLLIKDRAFTYSILPIIRDDYFSDIYLRFIFLALKEYIEEYHSSPTFENLKILLQNKGENIKTYNKLLETIETIELTDREFVIKNTRNFCFTKHALVENEKIVLALKDGKFDEAKRISLECYNHSGHGGARIVDMKKEIGKIHDNERLRAPIPLMFKTYNDNMKGGIGAGDVGIIVAPSNFGKSNILAAIARHTNVLNKNVVYFSYEETAEALMERYISGLIDVKRDDLRIHKKEILERIESIQANLKIIEDKASKATLASIKSHLEYLKSIGFFPDLILIDGLNQLKLPKGVRAKDDNEKYEILVEDLKEFCKEEQIPCWAVFQTNRAGFASSINDVTTIGRAIEVVQKADIVITFAQTPEMYEKLECVAFLLKNRLGKKEITLSVNYDPAKALFVEGELLNARIMMSDKEKQQTKNSVNRIREKVKTDEFLKKN